MRGAVVMGDVIQLRDYNPKIKEAPVQLEDGLSIIVQAMAEAQGTSILTAYDPSGIDGLAWPGMGSANYVAPEKDPA